MATYEQIGSELGIIKELNQVCDWNKTLHFCEFDYYTNTSGTPPTPEENLINEVFLKTLKRGTMPLCSFSLEEKIISKYGGEYEINIDKTSKKGAIKFQHKKELADRYTEFKDVVETWNGDVLDISFDLQSEHYEADFFKNLVRWFPDNLANMIKTQVPITDLLPVNIANGFLGQQVDFFLAFPNGNSLVLEPGDHKAYPPNLQLRDKQRDEAFLKQGIPTFRLENDEISVPNTKAKIDRLIKELGGNKYISRNTKGRTSLDLSENYLFLLPSLIARIEFLLAYFYFNKGLIHKESLNIGFIERDLECAVLALEDFESWVKRLADLYGIDIKLPRVRLFVQDNPNYAVGTKIGNDNVTYGEFPFSPHQLDLLLDVAIKFNSSTKPVNTGAAFIGTVRQTMPNNSEITFGYNSTPMPIRNDESTDEVLSTFLRDIFRKWDFREGQIPIIKNILGQKNTIGLLPTSGGKSICYQLASILTPGTTFIVDPINSLMENQANSLRKYYGIDRVFGWNSQSAQQQNVHSLLYGHIMVFISPERLQRNSFRLAMQNLNAAGIYINYVVIDEAHCISMWGHDFRPSYLMLESNIKRYCHFNGVNPPIVALTGTASQLVLIDMKRELKINELDAIVRPKSFNRPELNFNLVKSNENIKQQVLKTVENTIARKLNIRNLSSEAHGIIFSYTPKDLWTLFEMHQANSLGYIDQILQNDGNREVQYGLYCGSSPNGFPSSRNWEQFKKKVLDLFQNGKVRMLFGNNAIAVGIDNTYINYVINYRLPQSLEAYYQQSGRAGRDGQKSECYLIFTDDNPGLTQTWLAKPDQKMGKRFDDLGIVSYYHENNFPGKNVDLQATKQVFLAILQSKNPIVSITANLGGKFDDKQAERTEKYISYLTILGVIEDYEVQGSINNPIFVITLANNIVNFIQNNDQDKLVMYLSNRLVDYQNRYRPTTLDEIQSEISVRNRTPVSSQCITYLINFIYREIEYQRRQAIKTVVDFCNQPDTNPDQLRKRLVAYFDYSEKFSDKLIKMSEAPPNIESVIDVIKKIENFEDGEMLYYETRRFLDERMRPDWLAVNIFAFVFRDYGNYSDKYAEEFLNLFNQLMNETWNENERGRFIGMFLSQFIDLDKVFGKEIGIVFISNSIFELYKKYGLGMFNLIDQLSVSKEMLDIIKLIIVNNQLKEILNVRYSKILG